MDTLPPRPSCPSVEMTMVSLLVGSKFGAGELPGTSSESSRKLRPLSGSESICSELITPSTMELVVLTSGPVSAELMFTLTCSDLSCRRTFRSCCWPTSNRTCDTVVPKPFADTVTSYSPGDSALTVNIPAPSVVAVRPIPVALLVAMTAAPEIAAPEGSVTSPRRTVEPASCPNNGAAHNSAARQKTPKLLFNLQPHIKLKCSPRGARTRPSTHATALRILVHLAGIYAKQSCETIVQMH